MFGARLNFDTGGRGIMFNLSYNNKAFFSTQYNGQANYHSSQYEKSLDRHCIYWNKNNIYVDDVLEQTYTYEEFTTPTSILLCGYNNNTSPIIGLEAKIYGVKIFENDVPLRDFIPCYATTTVTNVKGNSCPEGTIGLYDTVNNKFYTNAGSGTFNAGQNVNSIVEID